MMRRQPRSVVFAVNRRAHAQATSERVQPRPSPVPDQQWSERISTQLPIVLRLDRAWSPPGPTASLYARHLAL